MSAISILQLKKLATSIAQNQTDLAIAEFAVDSESSLNFRVDVVVSDVTVATAISLKLQHRTLGGDFEDLLSANASKSITTDGTVGIVLHKERAADQADLPLRKMCRLVITTGAGDSLTVDNINLQL